MKTKIHELKNLITITMSKIPITKITLCLFVVWTTIACKKESDINATDKPIKQIQTGNDLYSYTYNTEGKISEVNVQKLDGSSPSPSATMITQLMYNTDEMTIRQSNSNNTPLAFNRFVRRSDTLRTPDTTARVALITQYQSNASITRVNYYQYIDVLSGLFTEVTDSFIYFNGNLSERITYQRLPAQNNFTNIAYYQFEAGTHLNYLNYFSASDAEVPFVPESDLRGGFNLHTFSILGKSSKNVINHIRKYDKRNGALLEEISNTFTVNNEGLILTKLESKVQNSITTSKTFRYEY